MTPFIEIDYKCLFWATKVGDNNNIDIGYISISMSNEQWIFSLFSLSTISFSFLFSSSASSSSPSAHFFSPFAPLSVIPFRFGNSKKIVSTQKQTNYEFWWVLPLVMIHYQWINCLPGFYFHFLFRVILQSHFCFSHLYLFNTHRFRTPPIVL